MTQPNPQPTNQPRPNDFSHRRDLFFASKLQLVRWRRHYPRVNLVALNALFDDVIEGLMDAAAEDSAREARLTHDRLKHFDEFVCPTCKEPLHPKAKACWKCNHDGIRKSYDSHISVTLKLRQYVRSQGMLINLALSALGRSAKQKKKGPFVRQARAILEAALAEPEPGEPLSLLSKFGIGSMLAMSGILAYALFGGGAYARSKMGAWGDLSQAGPPPTAEELSKSP